jgi:hypothetical protein
MENTNDPRTTLVRDKYFSMRPKPLERWLWGQKLSCSAERVFWFHWDEGQKNGTWCSQIPIRIVARETSLDAATVSRAYTALRTAGLLKRQDPGRDERNPFQQATALTEVFVPRELVKRLAAEPNRRGSCAAATRPQVPTVAPAVASNPQIPALTRAKSVAIFRKLSDAERHLFYVEQRARTTRMVFDPDTQLSLHEQSYVRQTLELLARAQPTRGSPAPRSAEPSQSRRLSVLQLAELRQRVIKAKGEGDARSVNELVREVTWSVEEGSLARFERAHAIAIACKKLREGAWTTPFRMPLAARGNPAIDRLSAVHCAGAAREVRGAAGL